MDIVGGVAAVTPTAEDELRAAGLDTRRLAGPSRYEAARQASSVNVEMDAAFLVSGTSFADALAVGPLSHRLLWPILLTPPDELHPAIVDELRFRSFRRVFVIGGTDAVSEAVADEMSRAHYDGATTGRTVERIAGDNRFATAIALADFALNLGFSPDGVSLARGDTFPDALAGGRYGDVQGWPLLFTAGPDQLSVETESWLRDHADDLDRVDVFGSPIAVSDEVWTAARLAAD